MKTRKQHSYAVIENKWDIHAPKWLIQFDSIAQFKTDIAGWVHDYVVDNGTERMAIDYYSIYAKDAYRLVFKDNVVFHKAY